jgi:uncharacterized Zn-binding protein involved in type VI secretion
VPPASRITDMHTCPMFNGPVPHVGGPILPPCCPTVMIGGIPAARVGDMCVCAGPPDTIIKGSATVFIGGSPAARIGDNTVHGGVIVAGFPTVIIGDGTGSGGGGGSARVGGSAAQAPEAELGKDAKENDGKKPDKITPKEADQLIEKKYGARLPADKRNAGLAEKKTKVLGDAEFQKAYLAAGGDPKKAKRVNGFHNPRTGEIFVNSDRANGGTPYHESLHAYTNKDFKKLGKALNEGTTEYFTQKETAGRGIDRSNIYTDEVGAVNKLAGVVGDDAIEKAYFEGDVDGLKNSVDKKLGEGRWDAYKTAMANEDYAAANKALEPPTVAKPKH